MALPPIPTSSAPAAPAAAVATAAPAAATETSNDSKKVVLKKFGPARIGEGDDAKLVPTPTAAGLDLVDLSKQFYTALKNVVESKGLKLDDVMAFCGDADKSQFPGHKDGRIAYATANTVASLGKINGLLNKVRGAGGGAAMKAKLIEKDKKIEELMKQLAELTAKISG